MTQHTDYALRVLIYLAANTERLATIQEIAERFEISRSHLMKVVNQLIRNGFVEGLRGKGGGDIRFPVGSLLMRTADLAQAIAHVEAFAAGHAEATRLYCSRRQREERFEVRRRTQKTLDALCRRVVDCGKEGKTDVRPVVVAFGDAGFSHASRGHASGPTKGFKRQLARHCHAVIDTSEFRSSTRCSACGCVLSDRRDGARLRWGVRRCVECSSSWWNRDVNAHRARVSPGRAPPRGVSPRRRARRGGGRDRNSCGSSGLC